MDPKECEGTECVEESKDEVNSQEIVCKKCSCSILKPRKGRLVNREIQLPVISKKAYDVNEKEPLSRHLCVEDIYIFENMGFSNTVQDMKYLVCADCEFGPIGYMSLIDRKSFVSLDRVNGKDEFT